MDELRLRVSAATEKLEIAEKELAEAKLALWKEQQEVALGQEKANAAKCVDKLCEEYVKEFEIDSAKENEIKRFQAMKDGFDLAPRFVSFPFEVEMRHSYYARGTGNMVCIFYRWKGVNVFAYNYAMDNYENAEVDIDASFEGFMFDNDLKEEADGALVCAETGRDYFPGVSDMSSWWKSFPKWLIQFLPRRKGTFCDQQAKENSEDIDPAGFMQILSSLDKDLANEAGSMLLNSLGIEEVTEEWEAKQTDMILATYKLKLSQARKRKREDPQTEVR